MKKWYIYALIDPRTDSVRYVGWTINPKQRLQNHIGQRYTSDTHKDRWLRKLIRQNLYPHLRVLEEGEGNNSWVAAERKWIAHFQERGNLLTNGTNGGEGTLGRKLSEESRKKISAKTTGRHLSAEHREKIRLANLGKSPSAKTRAKLSAALKGRKAAPRSAEWYRKQKVYHSRPLSEATRLAIGRANTGKVPTPEHRQKISEAMKGRILSAEHRANLREAAHRRYARERYEEGAKQQAAAAAAQPAA